MFTLFYAACAVGQALLAVVAIRLFIRHKSLGAFMLILPCAAVVWDNAMIALGAAIGDGATLVGLSWPRFIGHALFTPLWIFTGVGLAWRAGVKWLGARWVYIGQWVLYVICLVFGLLRSVVFLKMSPVSEDGLFYYANTGSFPGPPIGSITMLIVVLVCAIPVWRLTKSPWMFLGSFFMLAVSIYRTGAIMSLLGNTGEVIMAAGLVATEYIFQKRGLTADRMASLEPTR